MSTVLITEYLKAKTILNYFFLIFKFRICVVASKQIVNIILRNIESQFLFKLS